jgi:hypothetical protein
MSQRTSDLDGFFLDKQAKDKRDVRSVTWNARIPYRALPLIRVEREIARPRRRWKDNIEIDLREIK